MLSLRLTTLGRRAAIVGGAVAIASTVACSDDPTAPHRDAASIPTSGPQASITAVRRSLVTVRVENINGFLITETPAVKFFAVNDSVIVFDNTAADKDMTLGIITVPLPVSATHKACLVYDTKTYGIDVWKPYCNTAAGGTATVDLGALVMHKFPFVSFSMRDAANFSFLPGATITVTAASQGFSKTVKDGAANDLKPGNDGKIGLRGNRPGTYTMCVTVPPTAYVALQTCRTTDLDWDMGVGHDVLFKYQPWTWSSSESP